MQQRRIFSKRKKSTNQGLGRSERPTVDFFPDDKKGLPSGCCIGMMSVACWRLKLVRMLKFPSPRRRLFPSDNNGLGEDDGVAKWEEVMSDCHSLNIQREYKIMYAPTRATKKLSSFKVHWRNPWHVMMTKLEKRILVWEFLVLFFFFNNTTSDVPADKGFSQFFFKSMMTTIPPHFTTSCTVISCSKTSMIIYIVGEDSEILLQPTNPCRLHTGKKNPT